MRKSHRKAEVDPIKLTMLVALILVAAGVMLFIFLPSTNSFKIALSCQEDYGFTCQSIVGFCAGERYEMHGFGSLACLPTGKICCEDLEWVAGSSGTTTGTREIKPATIELRRGAGNDRVAEGGTVVTVPTRPERLTATGSYDVENPLWGAQLILQDSTGTPIAEAPARTGASKYPTIQSALAELHSEIERGLADKSGTFYAEVTALSFPPEFTDKRLKLVVTVYPGASLDVALRETPTKVRQYAIYFDLKPAVRYVGLTQQWSNSKRVTAGCEYMDCENIYFEFVGEGEACDMNARPNDDLIVSIEENVQWCVLNAGATATGECRETLNECHALLDDAGAEYSAAYTALKSFLERGVVDDSEFAAIASQFASAQSQQSNARCVRDIDEADIGRAELFEGIFDPNSQRSTFDMNLPFMSGANLCVYGSDANGKLYPAGEPQHVKLDVVPPKALIDFKPLRLKLQFSCDDPDDEGEASGCQDRYGVSYVKNLQGFFRAFGRGSSQSAVAWCPDYITGADYHIVPDREMDYTGATVSVLCLRVQDNAGNPGATMTIVYDGYDALLAVLNEYFEE